MFTETARDELHDRVANVISFSVGDDCLDEDGIEELAAEVVSEISDWLASYTEVADEEE